MLQNLKNKLKDNKGFSLVELIVVIAIMVILIALLIPQVSGYIKKANDTSSLNAARTIYNAGTQYQADLAAVGVTLNSSTTITKASTLDTKVGTGTFKDKYLQNFKDGDDFAITFNADGTVKVANYYPGSNKQSDTDGVDGTKNDGYQYPTSSSASTSTSK